MDSVTCMSCVHYSYKLFNKDQYIRYLLTQGDLHEVQKCIENYHGDDPSDHLPNVIFYVGWSKEEMLLVTSGKNIAKTLILEAFTWEQDEACVFYAVTRDASLKPCPVYPTIGSTTTQLGGSLRTSHDAPLNYLCLPLYCLLMLTCWRLVRQWEYWNLSLVLFNFKASIQFSSTYSSLIWRVLLVQKVTGGRKDIIQVTAVCCLCLPSFGSKQPSKTTWHFDNAHLSIVLPLIPFLILRMLSLLTSPNPDVVIICFPSEGS